MDTIQKIEAMGFSKSMRSLKVDTNYFFLGCLTLDSVHSAYTPPCAVARFFFFYPQFLLSTMCLRSIRMMAAAHAHACLLCSADRFLLNSPPPHKKTRKRQTTRPNIQFVLDKAVHRDHQLAGVAAAPAARVSVFTEIDALPLPEREPAVADGDGEVGP